MKKRSKLDKARDLYEQAKAATPIRNGKRYEADIIVQLKPLVEFEEDDVRERIAKSIINSLTKTVTGEADEQIELPGMSAREWDPMRLIRSDDGAITENFAATYEFIDADRQRSRKHAEESTASADWKDKGADIFKAWTIERQKAGDKPAQLTWGRCVRMLGLIKPIMPQEPPPAPDSGLFDSQ